jgi:salicylate hydroxylase
MSLEGREIAVIGAGIGGLAAAAALAQRRASVTVFERASALGEVGAGLQIAPNGVAVLEALGMRDAAEACAGLPESIEIQDHRTDRIVARLPLGPASVARYGRPYWHFHRADLLALLAEAAREAGAELRLGSEIIQVADTAQGLRVVPETGAEHAAEIVIGADGIRSRVRADWLEGQPPRFTGHVAWRGLVDASRTNAPELADVARVTVGPRRHIVTYPLRGGRQINFVAVEERASWAAEGWTEKDDPESLRRAFADWAGPAGELLDAVQETFLWGLFDHPPLPRWVAGRIALLVDACHPMLPYLAQGATMALEDAWVLAAELDVAETPERGLLAYEARRAPRAERVQRASARNGWMFHLRPGMRGMAHLGLRAVSAMAPGLLMGRFDWLYGADVVSDRATG